MAAARAGRERRELARGQRAEGARPDAHRQPAGHRARLRRRHVLPVAAGEVRAGEVPLGHARPPRRGVPQLPGDEGVRRRTAAARGRSRHPSALPGRPRRRLGLLVGVVGDRVAAVAAPELARAGARLERRALRARPPGRHRARRRPVRRLRRRRRAEPLHRGCRAGGSVRRLRRAGRAARRRPVLGRRRRHREGARRRSARPAPRPARRRGRRALADSRRSRRAGRARRRRVRQRRLEASGSTCDDGTEVRARYARGELAGRAAATRRPPATAGRRVVRERRARTGGHARRVPRRARGGEPSGPMGAPTPTSRR